MAQDILEGGKADDTIQGTGGSGSYCIYGDDGNDILIGGDGVDCI